MTWGLVASVLRPALSASRSRVHEPPARSPDTSGPAPATAPMSNACGRRHSELRAMLERRALMVSNRDRTAADRYLDRHMALASAICSEDDL